MIRNVTKGVLLVKKAKPVSSLLGQAFGLMFRKKIVDEGWVFLFPKISSWHITNLFVFQRIDVLWLDKHCCVLQKKTLDPFTLHASGISGTSFVLELPAGKASSVAVGDVLAWEF